MNLAFEVNGTYLHSTLNVGKVYHSYKSTLCEDQGIRLVHLHEHKWKEDKEKLQEIIFSEIDDYQNEIRVPGDLGLKLFLESKGYKRVTVSEPNIILEEDDLKVFDSGMETYIKS